MVAGAEIDGVSVLGSHLGRGGGGGGGGGRVAGAHVSKEGEKRRGCELWDRER